MFAGSFCEGSHPFQSAAGLRQLWPSPAYRWLRMARLSTKWYKGAVNNKIWKEKEEEKPQKQKSESLAFPLLGSSSVSRTDWKKFWFLKPDCFVWNLIAWRAFAEDKAAFSVEPAGFVRRLVMLLMERFAQSVLPLAPAAGGALRSGNPNYAALSRGSWGPSGCLGSLQAS